jgi:hypothetical protein
MNLFDVKSAILVKHAQVVVMVPTFNKAITIQSLFGMEYPTSD